MQIWLINLLQYRRHTNDCVPNKCIDNLNRPYYMQYAWLCFRIGFIILEFLKVFLQIETIEPDHLLSLLKKLKISSKFDWNDFRNILGKVFSFFIFLNNIFVYYRLIMKVDDQDHI